MYPLLMWLEMPVLLDRWQSITLHHLLPKVSDCNVEGTLVEPILAELYLAFNPVVGLNSINFAEEHPYLRPMRFLVAALLCWRCCQNQVWPARPREHHIKVNHKPVYLRCAVLLCRRVDLEAEI